MLRYINRLSLLADTKIFLHASSVIDLYANPLPAPTNCPYFYFIFECPFSICRFLQFISVSFLAFLYQLWWSCVRRLLKYGSGYEAKVFGTSICTWSGQKQSWICYSRSRHICTFVVLSPQSEFNPISIGVLLSLTWWFSLAYLLTAGEPHFRTTLSVVHLIVLTTNNTSNTLGNSDPTSLSNHREPCCLDNGEQTKSADA